MNKTSGPCPHCGANIVLTGDGRHPCSFCGNPLPPRPDDPSVRAITEGQQRWVERIWRAFGTPFSDPEYAVAPDGIARVFLNGLVFVCTTDSRCHVEIRDGLAGPPSDFKDLMIWRDEHGLDGSYEATYDALVGDN